MTTLEERVEALERQYLNLRVPPVRDELTNLRDVHGLRLSAIDARLAGVERDLSENESWIEQRFRDIENQLGSLRSDVGTVNAKLNQVIDYFDPGEE